MGIKKYPDGMSYELDASNPSDVRIRNSEPDAFIDFNPYKCIRALVPAEVEFILNNTDCFPSPELMGLAGFLREKGLVNITPNGYVSLTHKGREVMKLLIQIQRSGG